MVYGLRIKQGLGVIGCLLLSMWVHAQEYSREGLYSATTYRLENGLLVSLLPMRGIHTTSIRLVVGYGYLDEPCEKHEQAHYLEHLLFTGTSQHTEAELDEIIDAHGGYWNATTYPTETTYEIDIFDRHTDVALQTLYEILTDSQFTDENMGKSKQIILQELDGGHSPLTRLMARYDLRVSAEEQYFSALFPGTSFYCQHSDTLSSITKADVLASFEKFYIPNNMTLVVVGSFDRDAVKAWIDQTFATLMPGPMPPRYHAGKPAFKGPVEYKSKLDPIVGSVANIEIAVRTDGIRDKYFYAIEILAEYLQGEIFTAIRTEQGLAYSPETYHLVMNELGAFTIGSDVPDRHREKVKAILIEQLERLSLEHLTLDDFEETRKRILMRQVHNYIEPAAIAEYYADYYDQLQQFGRLDNYEQKIKDVTEQDIQDAIIFISNKKNWIITVSSPTLSEHQVYVLVIGIMVVVVFWVLFYMRIKYRNGRSRR